MFWTKAWETYSEMQYFPNRYDMNAQRFAFYKGWRCYRRHDPIDNGFKIGWRQFADKNHFDNGMERHRQCLSFQAGWQAQKEFHEGRERYRARIQTPPLELSYPKMFASSREYRREEWLGAQDFKLNNRRQAARAGFDAGWAAGRKLHIDNQSKAFEDGWRAHQLSGELSTALESEGLAAYCRQDTTREAKFAGTLRRILAECESALD